jgi:hypothetical protein
MTDTQHDEQLTNKNRSKKMNLSETVAMANIDIKLLPMSKF